MRSALVLCLLVARAARAGPPLPSQLQAMVDAAVSARARRFVVPPTDGGYFFGTANFSIADAADFELDGAGATLWFAPGFGVYCARCARGKERSASTPSGQYRASLHPAACDGACFHYRQGGQQ